MILNAQLYEPVLIQDNRMIMKFNLEWWNTTFGPAISSANLAIKPEANFQYSICCSSGLFILLNAEFLAMMLVVVYVGAVAVLFLFVVMMLDVDFVKLRDGFKKYRTIGFLVGSILIAELFLVFFNSSKLNKKVIKLDNLNNTKELGKIIYTDNIYLFQLSGLILLVAMIGAITLTMRRRPGVKKQLISNQNDRKREATVRLVKVKSEKNN